MFWVIQSSNLRYDNVALMADALVQHGVDWCDVGTIPFTDELIFTEEPQHDNIIFFGSTKLINLVHKGNWNPGVFFNDNFNTDSWNTNRDDMLNNDNIIIKAQDLLTTNLDNYEKLFIRPKLDLKSFCGTVVDKSELSNFYNEILINLDDIMISVSSHKKIEKEWRFFIIDSKIVTHSLYCSNNKMCVKSDDENDELLEVVNKMLTKWLPHDNVVMDVCLLSDGSYKVIEFNCLNASGLYACDYHKIIDAIERN